MSAKAYDAATERMIIDLYSDGYTLRKLSEMFGGSENAVGRVLDRNGVAKRKLKRRPTWTGSPEQRAEVVRLYEAGDSVKSVAQKMRCRDSNISAVLAEENVTMKPGGAGRHKFTIEQAQEIADVYATGLSLAEVAARYDTSTPVVANCLKRVGCRPRATGRDAIWTDERDAWVVEQYNAGRTRAEIAQELGVTEGGVTSSLRRGRVRAPREREHHSQWKGGRIVALGGYIQVRPTTVDLQFVRMNSTGYVIEHRLVMGRALGRMLEPHETVHHINGDRADNRLENLQLRQGRHGIGAAFTCADCGSHNVQAVPLAS